MPDPRTLIDSVCALLDRPGHVSADELRQLAEDFTDVCRQTDNRLRRCEDYLSHGLLGEAVHLAELEPPLLVVVGKLDFSRRGAWEQLLLASGLPAPPRLNTDRAAGLAEAYTQYQPIAADLREYRRLVIGRAPLHQRLEVL